MKISLGLSLLIIFFWQNLFAAVPLRFDVLNKQVEILPQRLSYEVDDAEIRLGQVSWGPKAYLLRLEPVKTLSATLASTLDPNEQNEDVLILDWPNPLETELDVTVTNESGKVVYKSQITSFEEIQWRKQKSQWLEKATAIQAEPWFKARYGLRNPPVAFRQAFNSPGRLCLQNQKFEQRQKFCTPFLAWREEKGSRVLMRLVPQKKTAQVFVNGDSSPLKNSMLVETGKIVSFFAESSTDFTVEFSAIPNSFELVEMHQDQNKIIVLGSGPPPVNSYDWEEREEISDLQEIFKWKPTIETRKNIWRAELPLDSRSLQVQGQFRGVFEQPFKIKSKLPTQSSRIFLARTEQLATYVDGYRVRLSNPAKLNLRTTQAKLESRDSEFIWTTTHPQRGAYHRSLIQVESEAGTYDAYFEQYKAFGREVSFRTSGVLGTEGNFILQAEGAFNYWFENILGWDNPIFSRQRWGVSFKGFKTVMPYRVSSTSGQAEVTTADLKYRLTPGAWNRDESWGLIAGVNRFKFATFDSATFGAGFFWARSMPQIFDEWFSLLPYMRYPKWVDLEFIYYPVPASVGYQAVNPWTTFNGRTGLGNWALNFHGKVMWTDRFFGEAGFGMKNWDFYREFTDTNGLFQRQGVLLFTVYATVGLGYNF